MKSKVRITKETYIWKTEDDKGVTYYKDGKKHREDCPAVEYSDGGKEWWIDGQRHRDDGPACIYKDPDGDDFFYEWFRNDAEYTEEEFNQWLEKKALNEKLQTTLPPKSSIKRSKI